MTTETAAPSQLYEAGVNFLVSDRTESNAWEQVAQFVHHHIRNGGAVPSMMAEFDIVEKQLKKDFEVSTMPNTWRSAKATAVNAVKRGIPLLKDDGSAHGKSDVGKLIKAAKAGMLTRTDFEKFKANIQAAYDVFSKLSEAQQIAACEFFTSHPLYGLPYGPAMTKTVLKTTASAAA